MNEIKSAIRRTLVFESMQLQYLKLQTVLRQRFQCLHCDFFFAEVQTHVSQLRALAHQIPAIQVIATNPICLNTHSFR